VIEPLAAGITIAGLIAALVIGVQAATGSFRVARAAPTLLVLEVALVVQAVAAVIGLARGHHPSEPTTHLAYLVVSLVVLPVAAFQVRGEGGRWAGALTAVALVIVAVLVIRLQTTWRSGRA
jgi:hypothetical protein